MTVLEIYDLLSTKESGGFGVGWPKDSAAKDLGILSISKTLTEISKPEKKTTLRKIKPKQSSVYTLEPRRSSRERNPVPSYRDDIDMQQLPTLRKRARFRSSSSWASYLARPLEEVKSASYEERAAAMKAAEKLQSNLQSENPSLVKSMVPLSSYTVISFCLRQEDEPDDFWARNPTNSLTGPDVQIENLHRRDS